MREKDEACRVVDAYSDLILRLSYTYLGSTADAEDVCQEVLLRLLRRAEPFESAAHERAWVVRVAANFCKDLLRRRSSRREVPLDDVTEPAAPDASQHDPAASSGVLSAVQSLPPIYREAVFLHYYEGQPIAEMARTCGATEVAMTKRLSRARAMLRDTLGKEATDEPLL